MSNIIFLSEEGPKEYHEGKFRKIEGTLHLAELPPGDWDMTLVGTDIMLADRSGQNPAMVVDKEGNWKELNPCKQ